MKAWRLRESVNGEFLYREGGVFTYADPKLIERLIADFETLKNAAGIDAEIAMTDLLTLSIQKGSLVMLSKEMLRKVCDDRSAYAFVCAHELAHIACKHSGHPRHSVEFEADRVAIEIMAKAGFETHGAVSLLETINDKGSPTHPSSRARIEALTQSHLKG